MEQKDKSPKWTEAKTDTLLIAEYNPRHISPEKLEMLKKSITEDEEFLKVRPIIVNTYPGRENIVIGGNQRLLAARALKLETVPVVLVNVDPVKEKVWNLKDNVGYGEWENDLLKEVIVDLKEEDVDLELVGFDSTEIAAILGEKTEDPTEEDDDEDFAPAKDTNIKLGDIIQVGDHFIMCGDSTKKEDVEKLIAQASSKPKLLVTSPPYGVGIEYEEKGIAPLKLLLSGFIKAYSEHPNTWVINFANIRCSEDGWQFDTCGFLNAEMQTNGINLLDTRIWRKPKNYGTAPYWLHSNKSIDDWEFINIYQKTKEYTNRLSKADNEAWGYLGVWEMENASGEGYHPAKFPIILPFRAISMLTEHGDYVIDPFGGSMTTLLACEKLGRKGLMMEMDPNYIESALTRIRKYYPDIDISSTGDL